MLGGLLELLVCPDCRDGHLVGLGEDMADGSISCAGCGTSFEVRDGIPILLPGGTNRDPGRGWTTEKGRQTEYYEAEVDHEFEIERPKGAPLAHAWVLTKKLSTGLRDLPAIAGMSVVNPCCGSGMEAEYLTRAGGRVIAIDLSEGCARRARARAVRHGLEYVVVVGDAERLPVRTGSADLAYVHDGLHHLGEPLEGVRELVRVARHAVSINEPADAAMTRIAVRLGIATDVEEAGNRVGRLRPDQVEDVLRRCGFDVNAARYLMYYRHEPGRPMRFFSRPWSFALFRSVTWVANRTAGRWGNKISVVGSRFAAGT